MHLGVDAGNSKTAALVCRSDGRVIGCGRSGTGDIYGTSAEGAVDAVLGAVQLALTAAGLSAHRIDSAAFRLAGVDWPEDLAFWTSTLARLAPDLRWASISNDGFAAIRCGEPSGVGVAVVAGTGPAVAARGPDGAEWSVGWWVSESLGAVGLGDGALRAVYRQALGIGPDTALTAGLLHVFGEASVESLLHSCTRRVSPRPRQERARAARTVLECARSGDEVATRIVSAQADRLAEYARVAAGRVGFGGGTVTPVILAGSVLTAPHSPLLTALLAALATELPHGRPALAALPPVAGAVLDAIAEAGVAVTAGTLAALRGSLPAPEFLQT